MALPVAVTADSLERLQLPDVRQPERMPFLPAWVVSRIGSLTIEARTDPATGKYRLMPELPASLIPNEAQREELTRHVSDLNALCEHVPARDREIEKEMLVVLTKMMMVLPSASQNELSAEARGEAFLTALEDIPLWAVHAAIRRWYRGSCGKNEQGKPYDYGWCPAPADLRRIALTDVNRIKGRAHQLQRLIDARQIIEFSDEHCGTMRRKLAELFRNLKTPPVGTDGSGGAAGRKPAEGAHCGTRPEAQPGLKREGGRRRRGDRRK
jgi:hypothetical protein